MKKNFLIGTLLLSSVIVYPTEVSAKSFCSNTTLKGTYSYFGQGVRSPNARDAYIYLETGMESYDGAGNVINTYTSSDNPITSHDTATYIVNDDCQGTMTYASGGLFIQNKGRHFISALKDNRLVALSEEDKLEIPI